MNFKDLLLPISLALVTTWAIQYFFFGRYSSPADNCGKQATSGQSFIAPKVTQEYKPINTEIDFIDMRRSKHAELTDIETRAARLVFSTDGGSLERLEFKKVGNVEGLTTIFPVGETEREQCCFLVALAQKTPYYYDLVAKNDDANIAEVTYQATFDEGTIQKKYIVYKDSYKLDLELTVEPKAGAGIMLEPRIFYPAPIMPEILQNDVKSAIFNSEKGSIKKITREKINDQQGWFLPTLFGTDNRYFVQAMIADPQGFARRAYYKISGQADLFSILEGPAVAEKTTWKLSFYFGPKEDQAFAGVDPRLEQTLDYSGILSPISKFLLFILKWLYSYIKNYGLAIIILTILVKLILLPFTYKSEDSLKKRTEFDKKLHYLQQRYKNEPEVLAQEKAALVKKHGMPGLASCLPLFLQLPIFIALARVLSSSIELYKAPCCGWINDLSARDPYYILPVLIGLSMLAQSTTTDAKQRLSMILMAIVFGAVSVSFSAGLSLYLLVSTILGVLQTMFLRRFKTNGI